MNAVKQLALMALGVMFTVSVAVGQLPLAEGFETMPTAWTNGGGFEIQSDGISGNYLEMRAANDTPPELTVAFGSGHTNIWWRGFAKVSPDSDGSFPDDDDLTDNGVGAAAAFFVRHDTSDTGEPYRVYARSDTGWVAAWTFPEETNPTNIWIGYAVHLDYNSSAWDLYINDTGNIDGTLKKADNAPFLLSSTKTASELTSFVVKYDTDVDHFNFLVAAGPVNAHTPDEIKPVTVSHTTNRWYASKVAEKSYASGQDNLGGALGADLAAGLIPGDLMRVYTTNGWAIYILDPDGRWSLDEGVSPGDSPANVSLVAGEPVWFDYSTVITDAFAFFDPAYDPATLPGTVIERESIAIRPNATAEGWTTLRWDGAADRQLHPDNQVAFPSSSLDSGSVIIVIRGDGTFTRGFWTGTAWETIGGAPIVLQPGNTIWVYNSGSSEPTWTPTY